MNASRLIIQALQAMMWYWRDLPLPRDGFHSFVDPAEVDGVKVRGDIVYGWVFGKAGFDQHPEPTKDKGLIRWIYPVEKLRALTPTKPILEQPLLPIFEEG